MKNIADLLKIYDSIENPVSLRTGLVDILNKDLPFKLTENDFKIIDNKVVFKVKSSYKNVLYINKDNILREINKSNLNKVLMKDIFFV